MTLKEAWLQTIHQSQIGIVCIWVGITANLADISHIQWDVTYTLQHKDPALLPEFIEGHGKHKVEEIRKDIIRLCTWYTGLVPTLWKILINLSPILYMPKKPYNSFTGNIPGPHDKRLPQSCNKNQDYVCLHSHICQPSQYSHSLLNLNLDTTCYYYNGVLKITDMLRKLLATMLGNTFTFDSIVYLTLFTLIHQFTHLIDELSLLLKLIFTVSSQILNIIVTRNIN